MTTQLERSLQTEILYRLARYPVVACAIPNGIYLPARTESERIMVRRIVARMREDGMLTPGAPDLVIAGEKRCVMVELKREHSRDLFMKRPRGRLSPEQKVFKQRCVDAGVDYLVAYCWEDVQAVLPELY